MANFDELSKRVKTLLESYRKINQPVIFKIDGDGRLPTQSAVDALNACKKAGANTALAAKNEKNQ